MENLQTMVSTPEDKRMGRHSITRLALTFTLLLPLAALAHPGSGHAEGFAAGFLHALLGWDPLLATALLLAAGLAFIRSRRH
jgi:hydrogenase/urease accessory protein HupE